MTSCPKGTWLPWSQLSAIFARYSERRGQPPYHPALMTSLLLYAYSRGIRGAIATGRQKHGTSSPTAGEEKRQGPKTKAMRTRLRRGGWRSHYRLRKHTVEPVFGQIKEARGFRQFLRRGLLNVGGEWALICTAHNLLKYAAVCSA